MAHAKWVEATCEGIVGFRKCQHEIGGYTQEEMEEAAFAHVQEAHITEYRGEKLTSSDVSAIKSGVATHFKGEEPATEEVAVEEEVVEEPVAEESEEEAA